MTKGETKLAVNWKKYIIEFSLLFLAVFLGFFADNYREKLSEKSKEKKYISTLIKDVETDKNNLDLTIKNNNYRKTVLDSLSTLCYAFDKESDMYKELYRLYPIIMRKPDFFIPNELTMAQLKNAGGMRLINNEKAVKAISTLR